MPGQAAEVFPVLAVPGELLAAPVPGARPQFRDPNITPALQRLPYSPKTPSDPPGTGGSTACPAVGRKRVFLRRGKVMARSGSCQHGRRPESTQMPLQPFFFGGLTRCLVRHLVSATGISVGLGTLGQSRNIPATPSPRLGPGKHLSWTFLRKHFHASLHPFLC